MAEQIIWNRLLRDGLCRFLHGPSAAPSCDRGR